MKKILIINTGGTIAMNEDQTTGKISPTTENPLTAQSQMLAQFAEISVEDYFHLPSPHITVQHLLQLSQHIQKVQHQYDGIVITHGTDTLEESAYFLDLTLKLTVPVVMTGAMRSINELGSDGLSNLRSALFVALDDESTQHGVVVVMNEEIHAAAHVTKTHTTNLATFQTPTFGPIGIVSKNNVLYFQKYKRDFVYQVNQVEKKVALVKAYLGMTPDSLKFALNYDGLVIEGLGAGNLPPQLIEPLCELLEKGVKIVMVSRAFNGITEDVYDYDGGGKQLKQMGIIFVQGLSGVKARMKLLVILNSQNPLSIEQLFSRDSYQYKE